jgi:hypothetical protein
MTAQSSRQGGRPTSTELQLSGCNRRVLTPGLTGQLTVGRNVTSPLNFVESRQLRQWQLRAGHYPVRTFSTEAEECPLLGIVTEQRLLKT